MAHEALGRFLSYVLRHRPDRIGIELDGEGWVAVEVLLAGCVRAGRECTEADVRAVVAADDKQRFALSVDGRRIRANQGHTVTVDLGLRPVDPPEVLYQGTVERFVEAIRADGLLPQGRHHVHLTAELATALQVGARRGQPVVLAVRSGEMARSGLRFYRSENGVWLTDHVPPGFIDFPEA